MLTPAKNHHCPSHRLSSKRKTQSVAESWLSFLWEQTTVGTHKSSCSCLPYYWKQGNEGLGKDVQIQSLGKLLFENKVLRCNYSTLCLHVGRVWSHYSEWPLSAYFLFQNYYATNQSSRRTHPSLLGGETFTNVGLCQFTVHLIHVWLETAYKLLRRHLLVLPLISSIQVFIIPIWEIKLLLFIQIIRIQLLRVCP